MFNQTRFDYLKSLLEQDKISDILRKEYAALLKKQKELQKVLDTNEKS